MPIPWAAISAGASIAKIPILGGLFGSGPSRQIAGVQYTIGQGVTAKGGKGADPGAAAKLAAELDRTIAAFADRLGGTARGAFSVQTFGNADLFGSSPVSLQFGYQYSDAGELIERGPVELLQRGNVRIVGIPKAKRDSLADALRRAGSVPELIDLLFPPAPSPAAAAAQAAADNAIAANRATNQVIPVVYGDGSAPLSAAELPGIVWIGLAGLVGLVVWRRLR